MPAPDGQGQSGARVTVASVTVTYNPSPAILDHIRCLVNQARPLDEIVVIDNASPVDVAGMVAAQFPQVKVIRLPENQGVGAYAMGMEYAVRERGHAWVWTMDDDSHPAPDALGLLLDSAAAASKDSKIGIVAPLPVDNDTGEPYILWKWDRGPVNVDVAKEPEIVDVDMVISSGSLISREAVETTGVLRAEFFMDWLDYEYGLRVRAAGFRVIVVKACTMRHSIGEWQSVSLLGKPVKRHFYAPWRQYYRIRNFAYVVWKLRPSLRAKGLVMREFLLESIFAIRHDSQKLTRLRLMCSGLADGIRGRLGFRVGPERRTC